MNVMPTNTSAIRRDLRRRDWFMAFPFEQWPSGPWISCLQDGDSYLLRPNVGGNRPADGMRTEDHGMYRRVRLTVILGPHRSNKLPEVRRLPPRSEVVASSTTSMATPSSPGKDMSGSNAELSKLPSDLPLCFGRKDIFDNVLAVHSFDRVGMNCERAILVNVANVGVVRPKGKNLLQFKRSFFEPPLRSTGSEPVL